MSTTFNALGVPSNVVTCLRALKIDAPYPIQEATLPDSLAGHDICAQSPTGSGKTLAFALPIVVRTEKSQPRRPRALVLAPSRELAAQITDEIRPIAEAAGLRVASFYGGVGFDKQLNALRKGVDIAVACPGRLMDLLDRHAMSLRDVQIAVVDEADRMSDMGFLPVVREILNQVGPERQIMLFSATLAGEVQRLIRDFQKDPRRHILDQVADDLGTREHEFWRATRENRGSLTAQLVATHSASIVFCRTKRGVDRLTRQLQGAGLSTVAIHGDRSQQQRERALNQFRDRRAQVLVGTDVAARGIHVDDVDCVVHFDLPEDADTYVHRSGRTGRAGRSGRVIALVTNEQEKFARQLQKRIGVQGPFISSQEATARTEERPVVQYRPAPAPPRSESRGENHVRSGGSIHRRSNNSGGAVARSGGSGRRSQPHRAAASDPARTDRPARPRRNGNGNGRPRSQKRSSS